MRGCEKKKEVLAKKKKVLTLPYTRKLTGEEIEELLKNCDYAPHRFDDDDDIRPLYDEYENPTVETMNAMYERRHGIGLTAYNEKN